MNVASKPGELLFLEFVLNSRNLIRCEKQGHFHGAQKYADAKPGYASSEDSCSGPNPVRLALSGLDALRQGRVRLILHAGSPKTGSSSLQSFLNHHRLQLLERGILYPETSHANPLGEPKPKHQWMVSCLRLGEYENFANRLVTALEGLHPSTHTVIFSSEGLFNHWWDFPENSKAILGILSEFFDVRLWVWLRDPVSYVAKFYKQALKNPKLDGAPACYGSTMSLDEFLEDPWFLRRLDYFGYVQDVEFFLGDNVVEAMPYCRDVIPQALDKLGIVDLEPDFGRENISFGVPATKFLRLVNQYQLSPDDKVRAVKLIGELEKLIAPKSLDENLPESLVQKVNERTSSGIRSLEARYGVRFQSKRKKDVSC